MLDEALMEDTIREANRVFHLASPVGVRLIMDEPVRAPAHLPGYQRSLECCARHGKRVLVTSTSEVYGKGIAVPFREDDDTVSGPVSCRRWAYACAKALEEFVALAHWREDHLPVVIVRLFNTVGPRQTGQYGMVVPRFVEAAGGRTPDRLRRWRAAALLRACAGHRGSAGASPGTAGLPRPSHQSGKRPRNLDQRSCQAGVGGDRSQGSVIEHIPYSAVYGEGFEDLLRRVPSLERAARLIGYHPTRDLRGVIADVAAERRAGLAAQSA